jgi:hypothetical protein
VNKSKSFLKVTVFLLLGPLLATSADAKETKNVGSVGIRIAQIPADVADHPYSKFYIVSRLQPGIALTQRLEVFNTSPQEFTVSLYPGMATFLDGNFKIGEGRTGNVLTSWTKLTPDNLVVKPGESKFFDMTITPPIGSSSVEHFGVIWAEVAGTPNEAGITSVSRVGIRMYIPVGDAIEGSISSEAIVSTTNEIVIKESFISKYFTNAALIGVVLILGLIFFSLFFYRRYQSEHEHRLDNEKILEKQWRSERDRRRNIWKDQKTGRNQGNQGNQRIQSRRYDEHDDEHY